MLAKIAGSDAAWKVVGVTDADKVRLERWEPGDEHAPSETLVVPRSRLVATKTGWRWKRSR